MPIYEYKCTECSQVQEKMHSILEDNKEECEKCGAAIEFLKRQMPSIGKHGSWSRWNVI